VSEQREAVLGAVRSALGRAGGDLATPAEVAERLADPPSGPRPALGAAPEEAAFLARLEAAAGSFERVDSPAQVGDAVARYLEQQGLPALGVISGDELLGDLVWPEGARFEARAATAEDAAAVVSAFAGVAETGSLVLLSGPQHPTSLNFLPEYFIAVLLSHRILPHLEDVWRALRAEIDGMPRTLNYVTGPSRTADVEQTIQMGAHGPRKLHVVLIGT
jgi:L-lactate dehydrogenase complex protein LldG